MSQRPKGGSSGLRSTRLHRRQDSIQDEKTAKFIRELVAATPSQRNWKGMLIALLVICAVCGLILFAIYLLRPPDDGPRVKGRKITLEDVLNSRLLQPPPFNGSWISDTELIFRDYLGGLSVLNATTLTVSPFVANTIFRQLNAHIYSVSEDRKFILIAHDDHPVRSYSFLAKYTIYDIENEFLVPLSASEAHRDEDQPELEHVTWSQRGSSLFFVYNNDIYWKPAPRRSRVIRITHSGIPGVNFNGVTDFLYEEEILRSKSALWPSPSGQRILYASFNDTAVGESVFPWYADGDSYPKLRTLRYPKTGTANPRVTVWIAQLTRDGVESIHKLKPTPSPPLMSDYYFGGGAWINEDAVLVLWMNRRQTHSIVCLCRPNPWSCEEIHSVSMRGAGWLDFLDIPKFSQDLSSCLMRVPWRDGEAGLFQHVVWVDIASGKEIPVTRGPYEVTRIVSWDQANQFIYFIAAPRGRSGERHLFRVGEKSSNSTVLIPPFCLTCPAGTRKGSKDRNDSSWSEREQEEEDSGDLSYSNPPDYILSDPSAPFLFNLTGSPAGGRNHLVGEEWNDSAPTMASPPCLYNQVIFSPNHQYFVRECLGAGVPTVSLHSAPSGRLIMILQNNTLLQEQVAGMGLPLVRTFSVPVEGGYHAPVRLFLPPGLRDEEDFKFPLVLHVAGSPGTQQVTEKWGLSWASYLTSKKNFIVAEIDSHGTGFQGESLRHSVYKRLGNLEVNDHLAIMDYLRKNLSFIDAANVMVWGRNYGAYLAALILADDDQKVFRCGIFVSPITRWEFYNTAFTERFMGMRNHTDNFQGYEHTALSRKEIIEKLQGKKFLLIHGTADSTVHFQHTLHFSKELIHRGITFHEQIYPDEDNDLKGVALHMYGTMESFIDSSFDVIDFHDWEKASFLGIKMT